MSAGENTTPYGSQSPGSPVSLVKPAATDPDDRRFLADLLTGGENGPPDNTLALADRKKLGAGTLNKRWLHIVVQVKDAGASCVWRLFTFDELSGLWCLDTRLGTSGDVTLTGAATDNPQKSIVEIAGTDRAYIEVDSIALSTTGINVWLGSSDSAV
jgi:hypothetical protein